MPQRKSIALYRKNLLTMPGNKMQHEAWLYSQSEFDAKGNLTEQSVYTQDGVLVERIINEFDANGFLIREKYLADEDETSEEKSFQRDDKGLLLKEFKHYNDGSFDTITYEYDKQYRIVSKVTLNDEGKIEQRINNEYRDDFLTKTHTFDGDNNLLQLDEFKYDEKGNSVEHKKIDNESGTNAFIVTSYNHHGRKKEEITYDEDGEIINETSYTEDVKGRLLNIIEEGSEKDVAIKFTYDEQDNIIHQEELSNQGKQLVSVKREFDKDNNLIRSEVYIDGQGQTLPQHYEVCIEYTFYDE